MDRAPRQSLGIYTERFLAWRSLSSQEESGFLKMNGGSTLWDPANPPGASTDPPCRPPGRRREKEGGDMGRGAKGPEESGGQGPGEVERKPQGERAGSASWPVWSPDQTQLESEDRICWQAAGGPEGLKG